MKIRCDDNTLWLFIKSFYFKQNPMYKQTHLGNLHLLVFLRRVSLQEETLYRRFTYLNIIECGINSFDGQRSKLKLIYVTVDHNSFTMRLEHQRAMSIGNSFNYYARVMSHGVISQITSLETLDLRNSRIRNYKSNLVESNNSQVFYILIQMH